MCIRDRPDAVVELWQQVEDDILRDIARRIRKLDELDRLTDTATWQAWRLEQVQACHQDVVHLLAKYSGKSKEAIRHALLDAGLETLARDDELYQALGFAPSAIDTNESPVSYTHLDVYKRQSSARNSKS